VGNEKMFLNSGFQDFISKPIDIAKLDAVLRRWVKGGAREAQGFARTEKAPEANMFSGVKIGGLDTAKALERFSGDEAVLVDVLRSYSAGTRGILVKLKEFMDAENLAGYAIDVHGVKGSSYAICADETGKAAEALEAAARAGDLAAVKTGHDAFAKAAEALLDEIDTALEKLSAENGKPAANTPDPALLEELRAACEAFDMDRVDAAMERLEAYRYEQDGELIAWLREKVDGMEFEEIAARINR
jgi:HPt (histidine-containing phosphotransfer) domain-containing protein